MVILFLCLWSWGYMLYKEMLSHTCKNIRWLLRYGIEAESDSFYMWLAIRTDILKTHEYTIDFHWDTLQFVTYPFLMIHKINPAHISNGILSYTQVLSCLVNALKSNDWLAHWSCDHGPCRLSVDSGNYPGCSKIWRWDYQQYQYRDGM